MNALKIRRPLLLCLASLVLLSCAERNGKIRASGTIEATQVKVSAKQGGELVSVSAAEGSRVEKGQPLAQIDHSALDLQLEGAGAGVELADAQLQLLLQGARAEDIQQAEEALTQANENLRQSREDAKRMQDLFATGSATQKQKDDAEARLVVAQAQQNSALQALKKLQNLARPEEIRAGRARLEQAGIAIRLLEKAIQDSSVTAPLAGVITHRLVEAGEFVGQGSPLFTIADLSQVELMIYVPEPDLADIRLGQTAEVFIDSSSNLPFQGRVVFISSEAEFTPKNVQTREERTKLVFGVKIEIENQEGILKPGMPADAVLIRQGREGT